jgi:isopenicillin N synthase-like dioxygenase
MLLPESRRLDFNEIPLIDIAPLYTGTCLSETIDAIATACTDVGFFYIHQHQVEIDLIDRLHLQAKRFFAQPLEEKSAIQIDQRVRGYLPLYYRSYEGEARAGTSHQEGFWVGDETTINSARPLDGPNQWPKQSAELRTTMLEYLSAMKQLSQLLMQGFALALNLSRDSFSRLYDRPCSRLKLNHYPPQLAPDDENNIGVVPHSDSGGFTILWQDNNGGLEVQNKKGEWVGAPPMANSFVVNLGNIMQVWSNGLFSSTPHRVINRNNQHRYSIPYFVNPDADVAIEPMVNGNKTAVQAFNYGDYQLELWRRTFPIANIP